MTDPLINESEPLNRTFPPAQPHRSSQAMLAIPALNNQFAAATFGRMESDYNIQDHTLLIDNQDTLSGQVYDQLVILATTQQPIAREAFIRMWKTLILKRTQDVYEQEKSLRPPNYINLHRSILLPGPLADLLYSLGQFHSNATGHLHHIVPPQRHIHHPHNWWIIDEDIIQQWHQLTYRNKNLYQMKDFPLPKQCENCPLMLTTRRDRNLFSLIKAWTNEPTPTDSIIRMMNDDLFAAHPYITYDNCAYSVTQRLHIQGVLSDYVGSYVIASNS